MSDFGTVEVERGVAIVTLRHSPANALNVAVCRWLHDQIQAVEANSDVQDILLLGSGAGFSAGIEIGTYNETGLADELRVVTCAIESCSKPVVASLHGVVMGAGLELALAAHYRIANNNTRIGFPEVTLGLVPCGGGTQRATRIIGPRPILDLLLSGASRHVNAPDLGKLFDAFTDKAPRPAGVAMCLKLRESGMPVRPSRNRLEGFADFLDFRDVVDQFRAQYENADELAPKEVINCVEAAVLLNFEAGLTFEQSAFEACLETDESFALRQAFRAENEAARAARQFRGPFDITRVVVLGGGTLAGQIVVALLMSGFQVSWGVADEARHPDSLTRLDLILKAVVAEGALSQEDCDELRTKCHLGIAEEVSDEGGLILLAEPGNEEHIIDPRIPKLNCVPSRVETVGLRFASPVPRVRLAEVVQGPKATRAEIDMAFRLCDRMGKIPVRLKSTGMSISDRIAAACHRAADALVDTGVSPYEVDAAMLSWGWGWPPFQLRDLLGLETTTSLMRADGAENWATRLVEAGFKGRASGAGFYKYEADGSPKLSRRVMDIINSRRAPVRGVSRRTIQLLMIGAMANEGARALADGWVRVPSDIDLVCLHALNFPRLRGGPMTAAESEGLPHITRIMSEFDHPDKPFWTPHALMLDLIKNGQSFSTMLR